MTFRNVSPVDGSICSERAAMPLPAAQPAWAARPLEERTVFITGAVENLSEMNDALLEELDRQMGRRIGYGGEIGGVTEQTALRT